MIERICALASASANRKIYLTLAETLNDGHLGCDIRSMCQAPSIYWNTFKGGFKDSKYLTHRLMIQPQIARGG